MRGDETVTCVCRCVRACPHQQPARRDSDSFWFTVFFAD